MSTDAAGMGGPSGEHPRPGTAPQPSADTRYRGRHHAVKPASYRAPSRLWRLATSWRQFLSGDDPQAARPFQWLGALAIAVPVVVLASLVRTADDSATGGCSGISLNCSRGPAESVAFFALVLTVPTVLTLAAAFVFLHLLRQVPRYRQMSPFTQAFGGMACAGALAAAVVLALT
ncbi:MAG: hypothetical protein IRZ08_04295 [Frankia sp.]|nr:hypothetical protein [Frankia sp.]